MNLNSEMNIRIERMYIGAPKERGHKFMLLAINNFVQNLMKVFGGPNKLLGDSFSFCIPTFGEISS